MRATVYTRCKACASDLAAPVERDVQPEEELWSARPPAILVLKNCPRDCPRSEYTGEGHPAITMAVSCVYCGTEIGVAARGSGPASCEPDCETVKWRRMASALTDADTEKAAVVQAKAAQVEG